MPVKRSLAIRPPPVVLCAAPHPDLYPVHFGPPRFETSGQSVHGRQDGQEFTTTLSLRQIVNYLKMGHQKHKKTIVVSKGEPWAFKLHVVDPKMFQHGDHSRRSPC